MVRQFVLYVNEQEEEIVCGYGKVIGNKIYYCLYESKEFTSFEYELRFNLEDDLTNHFDHLEFLVRFLN